MHTRMFTMFETCLRACVNKSRQQHEGAAQPQTPAATDGRGTMDSDIARWAAADHDDRVVPLHSYKFLATLQHTLAGYPGSPQRNPLLLRVDTNAGHGGGTPLAHCRTGSCCACW